MHIDAALADFQRGFQRLDHAPAFRGTRTQAILHHFEMILALMQEPRVTLRGEQRLDFLRLEIRWHRHREGNRQPRIASGFCARGHGFKNRLRRVAHHPRAATSAMQVRGAGKQQLQVIVQFRHRAHGRARRAYRIHLVDGDGRRDTVDAIDLRPVLAIKELARVRRKGFDITPLAFGIQRIEHQRGLAAARYAGDDDQLIQR